MESEHVDLGQDYAVKDISFDSYIYYSACYRTFSKNHSTDYTPHVPTVNMSNMSTCYDRAQGSDIMH